MWKSSDQRLSDSSSGYTATHWHSLYLAWLPGNETGVSTVIAAEAGEANHQMDKPWRKLNATLPPTYTQASMGRTKSPASNSLHRQAMERNPPPPPTHPTTHKQAIEELATHRAGSASDQALLYEVSSIEVLGISIRQYTIGKLRQRCCPRNLNNTCGQAGIHFYLG